jgi:hypothetical protein
MKESIKKKSVRNFIMDFVLRWAYNLFYIIMSYVVWMQDMFSPKGVRFVEVLLWKNGDYKNVSSCFYLRNMSLKTCNELNKGCYEVRYQINDKTYRKIVADFEPGMLKSITNVSISNEPRTTILSAFSGDRDVSDILREYAGPNNDFYGKQNLQLRHLTTLHGISQVRILNSDLDEFVLVNPDDLVSAKKKGFFKY